MSYTTVIPDLVDCRSGAVGDFIASANAYGPYLRPRSPVTDPMTTPQLDVRTVFAQLVAAYRVNLTNAERSAWLAYANGKHRNLGCPGTPWPTPLGAFIAANLARVHAGLTRIDAPPTTYQTPNHLKPLIAQAATVATATVTFDLEEYAAQTGSALLIYASPALPLARNFHRTPHQLCGVILGNSSSPPTSPTTITLPHSITTEANINFRSQVVTPDGRVSRSIYQTLFWDTPPVPIWTSYNSATQMFIGFDKPLDHAVPGHKANVFPRRNYRSTTTSWRFGSNYIVYIDPFEPQQLIVENLETPITSSLDPLIGYVHNIAPFLKAAATALIVQPFQHPIPWSI